MTINKTSFILIHPLIPYPAYFLPWIERDVNVCRSINQMAKQREQREMRNKRKAISAVNDRQ